MHDRELDLDSFTGPLDDSKRDRLILAIAIDLRDVKGKTRSMEKAINGNGSPEEGMRFRLLTIERWISSRKRVESLIAGAVIVTMVTALGSATVWVVRAMAG
jgi:hypothetical protein